MAKSEQVAEYAEQDELPFDINTILRSKPGLTPPEAKVLGSWLFKVSKGFATGGSQSKRGTGPWGAVHLIMHPVKPVGPEAAMLIATTDMQNLPEIRHYIPYTTNKHVRDFNDLMAKAGVDTGERELEDILEDLKGAELVATAKPGVDNRGDYETKLSNFRTP